MIYAMCVIRDKRADTFAIPFFARNKATAQRDFESLMKDPGSLPGKFPEDYVLYYFGDYDDETGDMILRDREPI